MRVSPVVRTAVSYLPSRSVIGLRRLADLPRWVQQRPHEADYDALRGYRLDEPKVVDVGANRGQAVVSLRRVLRQPKIVSFEPNPALAAYLTRRFGSRDFAAFPYGLGATTQTLTLYVPKYGHTVWDTRASLAEEQAHQHLNSDNFWCFVDRRAAIEEIEVEIRLLDDFGLTPDILKVDVEGAESAVIAGGMSTIAATRPVILVEGDGYEPENLLGEIGYRRHRYDPEGRRFVIDEAGVLNTFLLHPDHYQLFAEIQVVQDY